MPIINGTANADTLDGTSDDDMIDGLGGADILNGGDGNDTLIGGSQSDRLNGENGNDTLSGDGGRDWLDGGPGADTMTGGLDTDIYFVDHVDDAVIEGPGEARGIADEVRTGLSLFVLGANVERLTGIASTNQTLIGNELANLIRGGDGNNVIIGGGGNDNLKGGGGDTWIYGDDGDDLISGGGGYSILNGGLGDDDIGVGLGIANGGEGDDLLIGHNSSGIINGGVGNDRLLGDGTFDGGEGDDLINPDGGGDNINGGSGNDIVHLGHDYTSLVLLGGSVDGGAGVDSLFFERVTFDSSSISASFTGFESVSGSIFGTEGDDRLDLSGLTDAALVESFLYIVGGEGNDMITGGTEIDLLHGGKGADTLAGGENNDELSGLDGDDRLDGGRGDDWMVGGTGDDWFYVDSAGDRAIDYDGAADRVLTSVSYGIWSGIEILSTTDVTGTDAIDLRGNKEANALYGNAGVNWLDGHGGADVMTGFGGDDFYLVDGVEDRVIEAAGGGSDRVFASASYALGAGQEVEILSTTNNAGTAAINLTGNGLVNSIAGNAGNNVLNGGAGADTLNGFGGDDWYYVDNTGEVVIEYANAGIDRVFASVSYALGAGVQVELLSTTASGGTGAIDLTGNEFANTIGGNAGANVLDGLGGADTLVGNGGADIYRFSTALGADNVDTILGYRVAGNTIQLDNGVFVGLATGALATDAFNTGAAAMQADDRIIYNAATGALLFDADGSGAGAAVQFAKLAAGLAMTAEEFLVI